MANDSRGFTLLETLIALTVMVIAFAAILSTESGSINATRRARRMAVIAMLAKNEMVRTEYEIEGKSFDEVKKDDGDTFKAPFEDYKWTREIKEIEFPNLTSIQGAPGGDQQGQSQAQAGQNQPGAGSDMIELITKLVTQFLSKAVREVTVTIHWQDGGKEMTFAVSTYWVDLNHEFDLSQQ